MLEQSTSARETRRDDIWKYQTSLRAALLLPLLTFKWQRKNSAACQIKDAFRPALRARFTYGLACGHSRLCFTSKCPMLGAENTSQISEPQFLRLGTSEMPLPCTGHRRRQLIKNSTFPADLGARLHCVGQPCCMVLQGARKSPALLTSRLSLWEKGTWSAQAKATLSSGQSALIGSKSQIPTSSNSFPAAAKLPEQPIYSQTTFCTLCGNEDAKVDGDAKKEKGRAKQEATGTPAWAGKGSTKIGLQTGLRKRQAQRYLRTCGSASTEFCECTSRISGGH